MFLSSRIFKKCKYCPTQHNNFFFSMQCPIHPHKYSDYNQIHSLNENKTKRKKKFSWKFRICSCLCIEISISVFIHHTKKSSVASHSFYFPLSSIDYVKHKEWITIFMCISAQWWNVVAHSMFSSSTPFSVSYPVSYKVHVHGYVCWER